MLAARTPWREACLMHTARQITFWRPFPTTQAGRWSDMPSCATRHSRNSTKKGGIAALYGS
jgi:hypothetical protein